LNACIDHLIVVASW